MHSPVPPQVPSLPYPEAWRVKVMTKRPSHSAGQADGDVLQQVTLPGLSISCFPAELGGYAAALCTFRHRIHSSTGCAVGYRLVSALQEPSSKLCGLPKANTGPRFPKYMLITGPRSQQQWLGGGGQLIVSITLHVLLPQSSTWQGLGPCTDTTSWAL